MKGEPIPLSKRPADALLLAFFVVSLFYVALVIDIEQLVIEDPDNFTYPPWPPKFLVDHVHWYGNTFDPLQVARPTWWRAVILHEMIFFVPYYPFAIYAFIRGRDWIRVPTLLYSASLLTIVLVILQEEAFGPHAAPNFPAVLAFNTPWLVAPLYMILRMWRQEHPFKRRQPSGHPPAAPSTP